MVEQTIVKFERINDWPVRRDRDGALITFFKVGGFAVDFVTPEGMDVAEHDRLAQMIAASSDLAAKSSRVCGVIEAHEIDSLSCDRDGNTYCDCLEKATKELRSTLTHLKDKP